MKSFVSNNVSLLSKIVLVLRQTYSENEDEDPGLVLIQRHSQRYTVEAILS